MKTRTGALRAAAAALTLTLVSALGLPRAEAVDVATVLSAAQGAYSAYKTYLSGALTLDQATDRIVGAIGQARAEIVTHIDQIAAAQARACARSAIIDLADIERLSPDNVQAFARDATNCLTLHDSLLATAADLGAVDQLGFSVNALGPVVLLARTRAGLGTAEARDVVINANNTVLNRLAPSCRAIPLTGDAPPGGLLEFQLICRAYNGDEGHDSAVPRNRKPARIDFTFASAQAARNTSRPIAQAVLPVI